MLMLLLWWFDLGSSILDGSRVTSQLFPGSGAVLSLRNTCYVFLQGSVCILTAAEARQGFKATRKLFRTEFTTFTLSFPKEQSGRV